MFDGAGWEREIVAYALELGGIEEKIKDPKNKYKNLRVFRRAAEGEEANGRIFLIIHEGSDPLVVDFLVPEEIAREMVERFETASQSPLLDKKRAVQLVLTGQFELADVRSFILQSQAQSE
ncbi:hypothetical protein FWG86_02690 [Candidatus Saccharibacteria bacterium]|nr:hypothetical protein [Candidatus Saccharibacteria bacterium]